MEVILLKDMEKLGYANDIVNVKPGYANNYLIPQGYAKAATASAKKVLAENLKNNKVFAREEQQVWQCRNCGYTYIGKSAPLKCPVCAHPQSYFELKARNY